MKKSLPDKLARLLKGAKDTKEAWKRLDERFADRYGSIRTILKKLTEADLGSGKPWERLERLDFEIASAVHLLEQLEAENKLKDDINLVTSLVKKLPQEMKREWIRWLSSQEPEPEPGNTEWDKFREWMVEQKKGIKRERWYDEPDSKSPQVGVKTTCGKCGRSGHRADPTHK